MIGLAIIARQERTPSFSLVARSRRRRDHCGLVVLDAEVTLGRGLGGCAHSAVDTEASLVARARQVLALGLPWSPFAILRAQPVRSRRAGSPMAARG